MGLQGLIGLWGALVTASALFLGDWILVRYSFALWAFWMWGLASAVFFLVFLLVFLVKELRDWDSLRKLERVLRLVQDERRKRWDKKNGKDSDKSKPD